MIDRPKIYKALSQHLYNNFSLPNNVAWENVEFNRKSKAMYIEESFVPVDSEQASIGLGGTVRDFGFYRLNINIPAGTGTMDSSTYIQELSQLYKPGTILIVDEYDVNITVVTPSGGFELDGWWVTPLTINWTCHMSLD